MGVYPHSLLLKNVDNGSYNIFVKGKSMKAFKEVTEWKSDSRIPQHTYLLDNDKLYAYQKESNGEITYFDKPIRFDSRRRKFVEVVSHKFKVPAQSIQSGDCEVLGSQGKKYIVNKTNGTCSCPGFKFRGKCSHLEKV